jgi:hypothetical protein
MAHFLPSSRFIPSGLRYCVDSILRHPRALNEGEEPIEGLAANFYCALSTVNSVVDVDYVICQKMVGEHMSQARVRLRLFL